MSQTDSSTPNKLNNTGLEILDNQLNTPSSEVPFSSNICSVKPLKLKISTKKRKKNSPEVKVSPKKISSTKKKKCLPEVKKTTKKIKMDKQMLEEMQKMFDKQEKQIGEKLESDLESRLGELKTDLQKKIENLDVKEEIRKIDDSLSSLSNAFNKSQEDKIVLENRIEKVEKDIQDKLNPDNLVEVLLPKIRKELEKSNDVAWKANLAKLVEEHEHSIIIHGYKITGDETEKVTEFFRNEMNISEEVMKKIKIKEVTVLGKQTSTKIPAIIVKFGHPSQRNMVLPYSKNLRQGYRIDKNIPKPYQKEHKDFKRYQHKLRMIHPSYQTQIIFDSHVMVLRYKEQDTAETKYNWFRTKEFTPKPSDLTVSAPREDIDTNKVASSIKDAEINKSIIVSGIKTELNQAEVKEEWKKYFEKDDQIKIKNNRQRSKRHLCHCL